MPASGGVSEFYMKSDGSSKNLSTDHDFLRRFNNKTSLASVRKWYPFAYLMYGK